MDTKEPQIQEGQALESNVVRLPRDWLGPREELVPFGAPEQDPGPISASDGGQPDFWGETSAYLHRPAFSTVDPSTSSRPALRLGARKGAARRLAAGRQGMARQIAAGRQLMPVLLVAALAIAAVAGVITRPGAAVIHRHAHLALFPRDLGSAGIAAHAGGAHPALVAGLTARSRPKTGSRRYLERTDKHRSPAHVSASTSKTRATQSHSGATAAGAASGTPGSYETTSYVGTAGANSSPSSGGPTGAGDTASGSSGNSSSGGTSGQSGTPAGPVGPGAPFGPGHLG